MVEVKKKGRLMHRVQELWVVVTVTGEKTLS